MLDNSRVAPVAGIPLKSRPWEGYSGRKPWDYPVTAVIPHRDTPGMLEGVITLLRAQTVPPYILVIDAGSGPEAQRYLELLHNGSDDVEIHYMRSKSWRCSSQPVAAAMDLAFAVCQSERLFATHTDVFATRPDLIEHLASLCDERTPVVGWQMSPRDDWPDESWRNTASHTASCYHMPSMRALGASWNMLRAFDRLGQPHGQTTGGYPDTETCLSLVLGDAGITPRWYDQPDDGGRHALFLGAEPNDPYATRWFRHVRATGSVMIYYPDEAIASFRAYLINEELEAIPDRLDLWRRMANGFLDAGQGPGDPVGVSPADGGDPWTRPRHDPQVFHAGNEGTGVGAQGQ